MSKPNFIEADSFITEDPGDRVRSRKHYIKKAKKWVPITIGIVIAVYYIAMYFILKSNPQ